MFSCQGGLIWLDMDMEQYLPFEGFSQSVRVTGLHQHFQYFLWKSDPPNMRTLISIKVYWKFFGTEGCIIVIFIYSQPQRGNLLLIEWPFNQFPTHTFCCSIFHGIMFLTNILQTSKLKICYSSHDLNSQLKVCYASHQLCNLSVKQLLSWITNH